MGRSMLIVVLLMSTIFGGIVIALQRQMRSLPDVMVRNLLLKEAESVSDYALRTGIRNAQSMGLQMPVEGVPLNFTQTFNNFRVGHCTIDSIRYSFINSTAQYRARTTVRASMQGYNITYPAEMAFNFPIVSIVGSPNCFYFEMDQPQFHGSNEWIRDTSGNDYTGEPHNAISTRPHGSGANGWKCASLDGSDDYIDIRCDPGCTTHPALVVSSEFTLIVFAKVRQGTTANQGTLVWLAGDPYDTNSSNGAHPGNNLRYKPTAGIFYNASDGKMHFNVTLDNGPRTLLDTSFPYTPLGKWPHNKDPWHFFAMTFKNGTVKSYFNGVRQTTLWGGFWNDAIPSRHGVSVGRRDIRNLGSGGTSEYKYFFGLLDQVGMYNRALTDAEIANLYLTIIKPENILYIKD